MDFTNQQIENFKAYERVQMSCQYNMIMERVAAAATAGLSMSDYMFVIQNYTALREASKRN